MTERQQFEIKFGKPEHWIEFDESKNKYTCKYNSIDHHLLIYQARWEAWQASATRQGYKLVPLNPTKEMYLAGTHELTQIDFRDLHDNDSIQVYKAMIGAVE